MGISTLVDPKRYGLSLVLGGGEVKLFDMVSAYSAFANDGIRYEPRFILKIEDKKGNIIYESRPSFKRVLDEEVARQINDVLSDNVSRAPAFGTHSPLFFPGYDVAAKTGTSDDFKDAWTIGYTPSIAVGVWAGNNNNKPNKASGVVLAGPIFHSFLERVLPLLKNEGFKKPQEVITGKDILDGIIDKEHPHSILYYVDKENPLGPIPDHPEKDPLFFHFEKGVENFLKTNNF
jgi:membrane peptidoglycan carboxypeptidase